MSDVLIKVFAGSRRSGLRVVIPPQSAEQPLRLTVRQLRPEQVLHLPPLSDGEGLVSRILQLTPSTFLSPVLVEIPHSASLGSGREIVVLRSDNGRRWSLHTNTGPGENNNIKAFLRSSLTSLASITGESEENSGSNNNTEVQTTRITTRQLPQYFAVISRPRQEMFQVGPEGGQVISAVCPSLQCNFPRKALTKQISVGLSVMEVRGGHSLELEQQGGAVAPVITVEPRRRKFHKPITVTVPLPPLPTTSSTIETSLLVGHQLSLTSLTYIIYIND